MCRLKKYRHTSNTQIDGCMLKAIATLKIIFEHYGFKIRACCCGHKKYPMSIIYEIPEAGIFELFSGKIIDRKRNFYRKDEQGYYYIPEARGEKW